MGRRNVAKLRILQLDRGVKRYEVACRESSTGLTWCDVGGLGLTDEQLIIAAGFAHEERCGACSVDDVLARGDQQIRALADRAWDALQMEDRQN